MFSCNSNRQWVFRLACPILRIIADDAMVPEQGKGPVAASIAWPAIAMAFVLESRFGCVGSARINLEIADTDREYQ